MIEAERIFAQLMASRQKEWVPDVEQLALVSHALPGCVTIAGLAESYGISDYSVRMILPYQAQMFPPLVRQAGIAPK